MTRRSLLPFLALGLFLAALPSALFKPGLPIFLRGDEADHLGLAYSLLEDGDTLFEKIDAERVFGQFPFDPEIDLRLRTGAEGVRRFDAPPLYPLLAAPAMAVFGSNGLLVTNMLLLVAAIALAAGFLARRGLLSPLFFAFPFVLLSPALVYGFWLRPSALLFFLGAAAFTEGWADQLPLPRWRRALAGMALGLAAAHLPYLLLLALPLLFRLWSAERKSLGAFAGGLAAGFLLLIGVHQATLGAPYPGRSGEVYRFATAADQPWRSPEGKVAEPAPREFTAKRLLEGPVDRRRGFLPYFPLAILALCLWRAPRREWPLLLALAAGIAVQPWAGELAPGMPMNPALLPLYPAFLVFVARMPKLAVIAGSAAAMGMLGLQIVGVLGSPIPGDGNPHAHVRARPFPWLPMDVEEIGPGSGLLELEQSGDAPPPLLWAPNDLAVLGGREMWTYGREKVELYLESERPLEQELLQVRSVAVPNLIELRHGGGKEGYEFEKAPATSQRLIRLGQGEKNGRGNWIYRFEVKSEKGAKPFWTGESEVDYYLGAAVAFLGTPEELGRDIYQIEYLSCGYTPQAYAGTQGLGLLRAKNKSTFPWPSNGAARVRFATRWLDAEGKKVADNFTRSAAFQPVEPGGELKTWLKVENPKEPGSYLLEFDAVYENTAWFSEKNGGVTCRQPVEVLPKP
jgi:hypothetical protein